MPTTSEDVRKAMSKPQVARLKSLGKGMKVGVVLGERVLVKTVVPWTELDEVEKKGLLYVPESVKKDNTPLPSTGIIVALGEDVNLTAAPNYPLAEGVAVMFSKFAGADFVIDEEDFKILDVHEVLCTIEFPEDSPVVPVKMD